MDTYRIVVYEEVYTTYTVDAESNDEAEAMALSGKFDSDYTTVKESNIIESKKI